MGKYLDFMSQLHSATNLQKNEVVKKWIGSEVEMAGEVYDISEFSIQISAGGAQYSDPWAFVVLGKDAAGLRTKLLSYSKRDRVEIVARIVRRDSDKELSAQNWEFQLISIVLICRRR